MSRKSKSTRRPGRATLRLEKLEPRSMMAADVDSSDFHLCQHDDAHVEDHVDEFPAVVESDGSSNATTAGGSTQSAGIAKSSLAALPQLSSLPSAKAKLVLDFNGNTLASWGGRTNVVTPAYDIDGDPKSFSVQELANIREIWARVAEDYAPFNIDVTTVDPGQLTDRVVAKIAIGGSSFDWYGASAGGVAYIGGFYNAAPNVGFAFAKSLGNGNAKYTADAVSHEAGHLFGLDHQAKWSGTKLISAYNEGNSSWAPIMGVGYYSAVSTWSNGATSSSSARIQDDMSVIAGSLNGFGYRASAQSSAATAVDLGTTGTVSVKGLIARNTDQQWWRFTTSGGGVSLNVNTIAVGANLDSVLEIRNQAGTLLYTANASNTLNSTLRVSLGAGTYYAVVRSTGLYGYVGQYALTGSFPRAQAPPPPPPPTSPRGTPQIAVLDGATAVSDGGSVSFGTVNLGQYVDKTFTVRNTGTADLTLQALKDMPLGFTILKNLGSTTLQAGQSTTFTVRMQMNWSSRFAGTIKLLSNDADDATYSINVSGLISSPEITMIGATAVSDGGTASFGTTTVGKPIDITFTIRSDGTAPLVLHPIDPATMPSGFSIVSNIKAQTLASGKTTTFTIRMTATKAGAFSGTIRFITNDYNEGVYDIKLTGTVAAQTLSSAASLAEHFALIDDVMSQFAEKDDK